MSELEQNHHGLAQSLPQSAPGLKGCRPRRRPLHLFAGIQLLRWRFFDGAPSCVFSLVRLFDRAEAAGRLSAIVHDGEWYHVGTPDGPAMTRDRLSSHRIER
jgi:NDP-sugar pyrophosphorylase family protein